MSLGVIHFLRPLWLLGLLALPLLAWAWRARARRRSAWRAAVDPHLLPYLLEGGSGTRWLGVGGLASRLTGQSTTGLALIALALTCLALAGPGWRRVEQPLWYTHAPLVVALDLSSAMTSSDLPPSRLAQARTKLSQLLAERQGGQVALIAYAEDAYTVAPLTDDVANIALFLDALDPEIMPEDGRRADRALAWSQRLLKQAGFDRGDILLLAADTGDAGADARKAAADATRAGFRVSVLGLGSAAGAAYRKPDGSIGQARLDEDALQALARAGGGGYARLRPDSGDLNALALLDPASASTRASPQVSTATWQDQGYWLLPPLLVLMALAFRRGLVLTVLLACLWLPAAPIRAQDASLWQRPDQQAHARTQQGSRAYREGDYAAAAAAFQTVPGADGAYNLGNALAKQGRYQEAVAAYDRALVRQPGMDDAVANRQAVLDAMQRNPPPGANRNPNPQTGQGRSQSRPGVRSDPQGRASQSHANPGRQDLGQARQPPAQPSDRRRDQPRRDQDPQGQGQQPTRAEQSAADAVQRQRMRQALAQQGPGDRTQDPAQRREQTARRERSLATEALLKRVPDDPGALLRAKFQLEYERRRDGERN